MNDEHTQNLDILIKLISKMTDVIKLHKSMRSVDGHSGRPYNPIKYARYEQELLVEEKELLKINEELGKCR